MSRPLQERLGSGLRAHRRHVGLTQERIAERLGMDVRYVREIELGRQNLTLQTVDRIARTLSVDPLELLTGGRWIKAED